ncbi:MAG: amidase [Actinomycetia bacterium]|nr:amidase [Actinomycetes bacterium]MCP5034641.1 amidase [Actinomycetes bacterium]
MTKPNELDASEARRLIGQGELSPVELLDACLTQTDAIDPAVNAMVVRADERARAEAAAAADAVARGDELGPLHGLPVAIKDLQATAGIPTTLGAEANADHVPTVDAGIVARVRQAGGIVVGKTNVPERSIGANTVNRLFGATGNPFDPQLTCGGSSGGSAVVLAAEMVPLATGSDHGGSLRIPACYCGVVGHRSTPGVVPFEERTITQTFYSVQGPMGRTVGDSALLLSAIAGRNRRDPMSFPLDNTAFATLNEIDLSTLRVGVSEDLGGVLVSESVRATFRQRVERMASLVGSCVELDIDLRAAADVDWRLRSDVFAVQYQREAESWDEGFNPNIRRTYESALATPMEVIAAGRRTQMELYQHFQAQFDQVDIVICPGVSVSPFPWRQLYPMEIDGAPVENYMAWLALTASITVVGHPVTALPCGLDDHGLPFGLQLIGPAYDDHRLLSMAQGFETAFAADGVMSRPRPDFSRLRTETPDLRTDGRRVQLGS